jgi:hypothetical protein
MALRYCHMATVVSNCMSRPQPQILLEEIDHNGKAIQICAADSVYAVYYQGRPVTVRTNQNIEISYPGPKYSKSTYTNPGHAFNLADRLNTKFNTKDFSVVLLNSGRTIVELQSRSSG